MTRISTALGILFVTGGLAVGCGGGGPEQGTSSTKGSAQAAGSSSAAADVEITFQSQPDPPRTGDNTFEAMVMSGGQPVIDAEVSAEFFMPAMPAMNMPEMKNSVALTHEGGGRYRGAGNVMMAGSWDVTVRVRRDGQDIGSRKLEVTAK